MGIAQTSFVTFWLFEYASAHQIQWQDSQPNDGGHLVVEVEEVHAVRVLYTSKNLALGSTQTAVLVTAHLDFW